MKNMVNDLKDRLAEYRRRLGGVVEKNPIPQESKVLEDENSKKVQQTFEELREVEAKRSNN